MDAAQQVETMTEGTWNRARGRLKQLRELAKTRYGMLAKDVAREIRVSESFLYSLEGGKRRPSVDTAFLIECWTKEQGDEIPMKMWVVLP